MVDRNYEVARQHYSYDVLRRRLNPIVEQMAGKADFAESGVNPVNQEPVYDLKIKPEVAQFFHLKN